jgi:hypothetical protein
MTALNVPTTLLTIIAIGSALLTTGCVAEPTLNRDADRHTSDTSTIDDHGPTRSIHKTCYLVEIISLPRREFVATGDPDVFVWLSPHGRRIVARHELTLDGATCRGTSSASLGPPTLQLWEVAADVQTLRAYDARTGRVREINLAPSLSRAIN